ncbi:hypothetical protein D3C72_1784400 [compost metagenome]
MGLAPIQPIISMIELDANIAHQPTTRHILPRMARVAGLGQVLGHVQGKLLDHRPATNQVLAHRPATEPTVTHALINFVLDDPTLALMTIPDQLLGPERVTGGVHQWTGTDKRVNHCQLLVPCDYRADRQRKVPGALNNRGLAAIRWRCKLSQVNTCGRSIRYPWA